jgi:hypothetical protein
MLGRVKPLPMLVVVALASIGLGTQAWASPAGSVPVVRCPTTFGVQGTARNAPASLVVLGHPSSTRGLAAYTNFEEFLVAPAGMKCSGGVGADGNGSISVWPPGHSPPTQHSHYDGLTLILDPACAGCRAADACPFLPNFAASLSFPCSTGDIPHGEQVYHLNADTALFEDPPGVGGDGWPSGGRDPANGIVGVNVDEGSSVYRSTCTLPAFDHWMCTVSLNDVLARYGQRP